VLNGGDLTQKNRMRQQCSVKTLSQKMTLSHKTITNPNPNPNPTNI